MTEATRSCCLDLRSSAFRLIRPLVVHQIRHYDLVLAHLRKQMFFYLHPKIWRTLPNAGIV